ncbi:MAG TPA: hypothetical protein VKB69_07395 [Micromonosporaceae bacterium]|nr:hypothetical protein [Micromonosporaceae bacterium]
MKRPQAKQPQAEQPPATAEGSRMRRIAIAALGAAAVVAAVAFFWPHGSGTSDTYADPRVDGTITLYNAAGQAITSGSVRDKPFVAKAVESDAAPAPYDQPGAKATLLAYQPRQGAASNDWSGDTLTGASAYTDPAHPTVVSAPTDFTLQDFLDEFPPRWDGRVQLRIYLSGPNMPVRNTSYAATTLVVSGDTWHVASPSGSTAAAFAGATAPLLPPGDEPRRAVGALPRRTGVVGA